MLVKNRYFFYVTWIWCPCWGWSSGNFTKEMTAEIENMVKYALPNHTSIDRSSDPSTNLYVAKSITKHEYSNEYWHYLL